MTIQCFPTIHDDALSVRHTVFVDEQGFVDDPDELDPVATHLVLYDQDTPIATCRVFFSLEQQAFVLGRFAVCKPFRGRGLGRMLLSAAEDCVRRSQGTSLLLHSQLHAVGFYAACGYECFGEVEYEQDQPHIWMKKEW